MAPQAYSVSYRAPDGVLLLLLVGARTENVKVLPIFLAYRLFYFGTAKLESPSS